MAYVHSCIHANLARKCTHTTRARTHTSWHCLQAHTAHMTLQYTSSRRFPNLCMHTTTHQSTIHMLTTCIYTPTLSVTSVQRYAGTPTRIQASSINMHNMHIHMPQYEAHITHIHTHHVHGHIRTPSIQMHRPDDTYVHTYIHTPCIQAHRPDDTYIHTYIRHV
jgi:hypothetical protein